MNFKIREKQRYFKKSRKKRLQINRSLTQWVLGFEDLAKSICKNSAVLANWEEALANEDSDWG